MQPHRIADRRHQRTIDRILRSGVPRQLLGRIAIRRSAGFPASDGEGRRHRTQRSRAVDVARQQIDHAFMPQPEIGSRIERSYDDGDGFRWTSWNVRSGVHSDGDGEQNQQHSRTNFSLRNLPQSSHADSAGNSRKWRRVLRASDAEFASVLESIRWILLERLLDRSAKRNRNIVAQVIETRRRLSQICGENRLRRCSCKWRRAGEHLMTDDAERVNVCPVIDIGAAE